MSKPRVSLTSRRSDDPLARCTYRHRGNILAGTLGSAVFVISAVRDADGGMRLIYVVAAIAFAWLGCMCRVTITRDALIVQNYGRPRVVPWPDITAVHMPQVKRNDVLQLELRDHRTVRVWAVAVGLRSGGEGYSRQVMTRLEAARKSARGS